VRITGGANDTNISTHLLTLITSSSLARKHGKDLRETKVIKVKALRNSAKI
jgi:hypothetical protein